MVKTVANYFSEDLPSRIKHLSTQIYDVHMMCSNAIEILIFLQ